MPKKFNNFKNFFDQVSQVLDSQGVERNKYLSKIPNNSFNLRPGDILLFDYPPTKSKATVLVVTTKKSSGVRLSSRGNLLLTCFKINNYSSIITEISRLLYKNRRRSSYEWIIKNMKILLGKNKFRTYKLAKIINLSKLNVG